mmetsp:Transcript_30348/g.97045  ORF Transcript_30348/g.97045 Transcript_30348/m.97045 type:complete len:276 (-) Transcript_30348:126-953(-)
MYYAVAFMEAIVVSASLSLKADKDVHSHGEALPSRSALNSATVPISQAMRASETALAVLQASARAVTGPSVAAAAVAKHKSQTRQRGGHALPDVAPASAKRTQQPAPGRFWSLKKGDSAESGAASAKTIWGTKKLKTSERGSPSTKGTIRAQKGAAVLAASAEVSHLAPETPDASDGKGNMQVGNMTDGLSGPLEDRLQKSLIAPTSRSHRQLTIIIIILAVVAVLTSCIIGIRMRSRPRGPFAGDVRVQKEFSENQGPPPHLRVRHWLTGDSRK